MINDVIHAVRDIDTVKGMVRYSVRGLEASRLRFK